MEEDSGLSFWKRHWLNCKDRIPMKRRRKKKCTLRFHAPSNSDWANEHKYRIRKDHSVCLYKLKLGCTQMENGVLVDNESLLHNVGPMTNQVIFCRVKYRTELNWSN
jgi:hypothetical protein